uniref:Peptidase M13 C-terminal domain-containing protein n=1 Tax=Biomphalaria glabrata TaxID=6526 RepID=A0A2C9K9N3_BIOGL
MNFARIGMIIAHEIMHAFDSTTILTQNDKSSGEAMELDVKKYTSRRDCFIEQYSGFMWKGYEISTTKTLRENICDSLGLRLSYQVNSS